MLVLNHASGGAAYFTMNGLNLTDKGLKLLKMEMINVFR